MKTNKADNDLGRSGKLRDYPELQVGFPERNDATTPNNEMERIHVDLDTMEISRKKETEVTDAIVGVESTLK